VARIRAAMPADDEIRITREQIDNFALAFVAPMTSDNRGYGHGVTLAGPRRGPVGGNYRAKVDRSA